jgi:hypothetical protein
MRAYMDDGRDQVHQIDDVYVWLEQESSVQIKAVSPHGDPVELSPRDARQLAEVLTKLADEADS